MTIPSTPSFTQIPNTVQELLKGYRTYDKVMKRGLIDVKNTTRFVSEQIKENTKLAKELKQVNDAFYKKMPGGGTPKNAGIAGGNLLSIVLQGGLAAAVIHSTLVQNYINDIVDANQVRLGNDMSKILTIISGLKSRLDGVQARIKNIDSTLKDTLDKTRAEIGGASKNATDARQKANDALYEVRAGRAKLEAQITDARQKANDALYETRQGRAKLESQIAEAKKQSNDALYETRQGRSKLENQITSLQNEFKRLNNAANTEFQKQIQTTIANISKGLAEAKQQATNAQNKADKFEMKVTVVEKAVTTVQATVAAVQKQSEQWGVQVTTFLPKLAEITSGLTIWRAQVVEPQLAQVTQSQFSTSARVDNLERIVTSNGQQQLQTIKNIDNTFEGRAREWNDQINQQRQELNKIKTITIEETTTKNINKQELDKLKQDLDKTKQDLNNLKPELNKLQTKINEQEKMNQQGLDKLNQITPLVGLIPGLANNTANKVREFTPTIPQIEQAAATGTCRTTQPGGCSRKMMDDAVNNINSNTNNKSKDLLDKFNAGANTAQLALLQGIDNKLGPLLPDGGISAFLQKFFDRFNEVAKWLHLDRLLNILVFAATVHNAFMLSNNIGQTLMGAINNVLQLIGLKDAKGGNIDIGQIINSTVEGIVKGIVGEQNYQTISTAWAKANRIYQATTNVLNGFQNVSNTILSGLELIGGYTGKIGNALKKAGEVLDNAYGWMNPQPKFNRITQTLENLQQGASTIQQVTQVPLDVINAVTELQTANTELVKAIKEDSKPENKGISAPEPEKLKADELASKLANRISNISSEDKFNGAD